VSTVGRGDTLRVVYSTMGNAVFFLSLCKFSAEPEKSLMLLQSASERINTDARQAEINEAFHKSRIQCTILLI
jgi:hypothetical protein